MRIDKFLKLSRLIKRRTIANEACSAGRVSINDKPAKPGSEVAVGDVIELRLGATPARYEVLAISDHVTKDGAALLYRPLP